MAFGTLLWYLYIVYCFACCGGRHLQKNTAKGVFIINRRQVMYDSAVDNCPLLKNKAEIPLCTLLTNIKRFDRLFYKGTRTALP